MQTDHRLMLYDIRHDRQRPDLAACTDADPCVRNDGRCFIAVARLPDGRLRRVEVTGLAVCDQGDQTRQQVGLPGYGWAQVTADVDAHFALAAHPWTGDAARVGLEDEKILRRTGAGCTVPFRSLAGMAVFRQ